MILIKQGEKEDAPEGDPDDDCQETQCLDAQLFDALPRVVEEPDVLIKEPDTEGAPGATS